MDRNQPQRTFVETFNTPEGTDAAVRAAHSESVSADVLATGAEYNVLPDNGTPLSEVGAVAASLAAERVAYAVEEYSRAGNNTSIQDTMGSAYRYDEQTKNDVYRREGQERADDATKALSTGGAIVRLTNVRDRYAGQPLTRISLAVDAGRQADRRAQQQ